MNYWYIVNRALPQNYSMTVYHGDRGVSIDPFLYALLALIVIGVWVRKRTWQPALWTLIFGYYLILVMRVTLFPMHISGAYADDLRTLPLFAWVYLNPMEYARANAPFRLEALGMGLNLLLTVPFGFMIALIRPMTLRRSLWLGLAAGFAIEFTQFILTLVLQHPYREIDPYDLLMNAAGVVAGYLLYRLSAFLLQFLRPHPSP